MEKTILQKLYNGEVAPYEKLMVGNREFVKVNEKVVQVRQTIIDNLPADERPRVEELENLYMDASELEIEEAFSRGFKLAVQLVCSVFSDKDATPQEKK
jgi:hypothetical protein